MNFPFAFRLQQRDNAFRFDKLRGSLNCWLTKRLIGFLFAYLDAVVLFPKK